MPVEVKLLKNFYLQLEIKSSTIGFGAGIFISCTAKKYSKKEEYTGYGPFTAQQFVRSVILQPLQSLI